ncbi:hypothetical protein LTR64_005099 [Lithohypha guttulata]|uniref:uncharacterized protein n=1 Tax=Lithohypha guttulata TaxID=1690604 RepID=UPI00315DFA5F
MPNEEKIEEETGKVTVNEEKECEKAGGEKEENNEEDSLDAYSTEPDDDSDWDESWIEEAALEKLSLDD